MKRILPYLITFICFLSGYHFSMGQNYGNEWINPNQEYFKIQVASNGIYRITHAELLQSGFLNSSPDPRDFQLFHQGEEIAIHVEGQLDGSFDPSDYIDFYGIRNDGKRDGMLYETNAQPHSFYALYSDSSSYFLTWNLNNIRGLRIPAFTQTTNVDNLPAENYHSESILELKVSQFSDGLQYPFYDQNPEMKKASFDFGEGWTGNAFSRGQQYRDTLVTIINRSLSGPPPRLEILLAGRNNLAHNISISAGPSESNLRAIGNPQFERHYNLLFSSDLAWTDISSDGNLYLRIIPNGVNGAADRISVSYIRLVFPQQYHTGGTSYKSFYLPANPGNISYIEIDGVTSPGTLWDITDLHAPVNIIYPAPLTTLNTLVPNTAIPRTLIYSEERLSIPSIRKVNFRTVDPSLYNYLLVYHVDFTGQGGSYSNPVQAYAEYRQSTGQRPLMMEIHTLYDQFNYGEISPLAVRNFCRYMLDQGNPEYLLLIGKGLTVNHDFHRKQSDPAFSEFRDWVPTAGNPGSDILFTANLSDTTYGPAIPTGRISATSPRHVADYLDKVKETESFRFDNLWKKDIIQLSGGIQPGEPEIFRYYIDQFKLLEENLYLGGNVTNVSKETTETVEFVNITDEVNQGKSLILFFGHSGTLGSDIDIGEVSDPRLGYDNRGKYPLIYMNGCDAGNVFTTVKSFGEDWMITGNKGAIAFSAHSDVGYTRELRRYTDAFLSIGYGDSAFIDQSLGTIFIRTAEKYISRYALIEEINIAQIQQTILQGDPFIRLFGADKPDYSILGDEISAIGREGETVTSEMDSFDIIIPVKNFGRAEPSPFFIGLRRTYPDQSLDFEDPVLYDPVFYQDTLRLTVENDPLKSFGLNSFEIQIDPFDSIPELSKMNNRAVFNLDINKLGTQNLFPYNYSIVSADSVSLIAKAATVSDESRQFMFQMDTSALFNSPAIQNINLDQKWIAEWNTVPFRNIPEKDTMVFFWRTRFADTRPGEEDTWSSHSFTYIKNGPEGWAQSHPQQLLENSYQGMAYDADAKKWDFSTYESSLEVNTYGANHPEKDYEDIILRIDGSAYIFNTRLCTDNSLNAVAFDRITTAPYKALDFGVIYDILDRRTCGRQPQVINNMLNNEILGPQDYLRQYIDAVKEGDPVLIFSIGQVTFQSWPQELRDKLLEIGVAPSEIEGLSDGDPMIILGEKGATEGSATVIIADEFPGMPADEQEILLNTAITGQSVSATMVTGLIGPSGSWNRFSHSVLTPDSPGDDHYYFSITGKRTDDTETILLDNIKDQSIDLSGIDPSEYPYLRLTFNTSDTSMLTPAQLRNWMVIYTPLPDGVLLPAENQAISGTTVQEGENYLAGFNFMNISDKNFTDSIQVFFTLSSQETTIKYSDSIRIDAPLSGSSTGFTLSLHTKDQAGTNELNIVGNPGIQPEQNFANNRLILPGFLVIKPDNIHPTIDVAFDGRYILDGEIVSPSPLISVIMKDENKILPKQDTVGITLALLNPGQQQFSRIPFTDPDLTWLPASEKKDFTIEYQPPLLADGIYTLSVQAEDASGNTTGAEPYEIRFEVINESQITHFYPFPNPFSSSTRFVFTLTGSIIPEMKIQIMTVSGKVVREILADEIGPIHIGNNITEYSWNGKDDFGDQLANGVYLYRVIIHNPGDNFKHRETAGDQGFDRGFGKIYLLR
ncbi:MAG: hypothetical protein KFF73_10375 [Cyclobacteriaceae bacterium]|nr:hypothetical protein [Cyclobacteriaceae bacterium]